MNKVVKTLFFIGVVSIAILSAAKIKPHVSPADCVGCGDCIQVCPKAGAIEVINGKAVIDPSICIACNFCVDICSFDAVKK